MKKLFVLLACIPLLFSCRDKEPWFQMRGVVINTEDMAYEDWPRLAAESGINTIGTHMTPGEVVEFMATEKGALFLENCRKYGIEVEHQLHAMHELLPRELFAVDSMMFRMNEEGRRAADFNFCTASEKALEIIAENAARYAALLPATNHKYYFWMDDGAPTCQCDYCLQYTPSEQALIAENKMIEKIREVDPDATLAHLAYLNTLSAPRKVKPGEGIFLEFAPHCRSWAHPLTDPTAHGRGMANIDNYRYLKDNLSVFPAETAVILEYWLDVSLFSDWTKPAIELPWHEDVFLADIDTYAELGIRNVTSFAVYMDEEYFTKFPDAFYLEEYGEGMKNYQPKASGKEAEQPGYTVASVPDGTITVDAVQDEPAWSEAGAITHFINPWSGDSAPRTTLRLLKDSGHLYFLFEVDDNDIVIDPADPAEKRVANEDRVELFFAKDAAMNEYYVLEIDPAGFVMDYKASYYRNFDFDWNLEELKTAGIIAESGYCVEGAIPLAFLEALQGDDGKIYWGAYRGEFCHDDGRIIPGWLTWIDSNTVEPDFHVPATLGVMAFE